MYLREQKPNTNIKKFKQFHIFLQSVFTSSDYKRQYDESEPTLIKMIHFTRNDFVLLLENLNIGKAKGPGGLKPGLQKNFLNASCILFNWSSKQ